MFDAYKTYQSPRIEFNRFPDEDILLSSGDNEISGKDLLFAEAANTYLEDGNLEQYRKYYQ